MLHYIVTYTYNIYIITLRYITTSYKKMCQINPGVEWVSIIISKLCLELTPVEENILAHVMSELYIEKKEHLLSLTCWWEYVVYWRLN